MTAAKTSSTEAVRILLKKDDNLNLNNSAVADPNKVDGHGITALDYALKTDNTEIIDILAEVTTVFTNESIKILAQSNVKVVGHLEEYIQRIINQHQESVKLLLSSATFYGNSQLIEYRVSHGIGPTSFFAILSVSTLPKYKNLVSVKKFRKFAIR